jgi:spermidine/putrescine transport system permease protein
LPSNAASLWSRFPLLKGYALVSPAVLLMILALVYPLLLLVGISFTVETGNDGEWVMSLVNYEFFFEKAHYVNTLVRSILISTTVAVATVLLAYPAAYFIAFHVQRNKMLWLIMITLPFWTSYLLRVFSWKLVLGSNRWISYSTTPTRWCLPWRMPGLRLRFCRFTCRCRKSTSH